MKDSKECISNILYVYSWRKP